jgi:hypothetical protein
MHRGDDPRIAARGNRMMALWTARGDGPFGSGPLATALSDDGGRTWRAGPTPVAEPLPASLVSAHVRRAATLPALGADAAHAAAPPAAADGSAAGRPRPTNPSHAGHAGSGQGSGKGAAGATGPGYRFPAAAAGADAFHVVWIHAAGEERSLRHARLPFGAAAWSEPTVVDPHICACCWNALKVERDGTVLALYRDQQPSDMSLAVSRDAGRTWENAGRAGRFDWSFDGCPHVGGGVATVSSDGGAGQVLATVWTGKAGSVGTYVLSRAGDGTWSRPAPLTSGDAPGRNTDVAAKPGAQSAAAAWDQAAPEGGQCVFVTVTSDGGRTWSARRLSPTGENASYPRVVPLRDRFLVLWTSHAQDGATSMRVKAVAAE